MVGILCGGDTILPGLPGQEVQLAQLSWHSCGERPLVPGVGGHSHCCRAQLWLQPVFGEKELATDQMSRLMGQVSSHPYGQSLRSWL